MAEMLKEELPALTLPRGLVERAGAGTLAHAYILSGENAQARMDAARAVAAAMVCRGEHPPCGECKQCRKAAKGIHPDIIAVEKRADKREIVVEQVRTMRSDAYIRPNEAERKVYVIHDAHLMNEEAQNAFLKVLEDGPSYAAFLLLTPTPEGLLPTIRSRCETVLSAVTRAAEDPDLTRRAGELAGLLLEENRWRLISWCVSHEKDKREDMMELLEETRKAVLRYRNKKTTPKAVTLALVLQEQIDRLDGYANTGCVLGRLWAEAGESGRKV